MTTSKLGVFCDRLIEAGWLIVVITTPLFFNSNTNRVMEADKLVLVRSLASLMVAAWLIRWLDQRRGVRLSACDFGELSRAVPAQAGVQAGASVARMYANRN